MTTCRATWRLMPEEWRWLERSSTRASPWRPKRLRASIVSLSSPMSASVCTPCRPNSSRRWSTCAAHCVKTRTRSSAPEARISRSSPKRCCSLEGNASQASATASGASSARAAAKAMATSPAASSPTSHPTSPAALLSASPPTSPSALPPASLPVSPPASPPTSPATSLPASPPASPSASPSASPPSSCGGASWLAPGARKITTSRRDTCTRHMGQAKLDWESDWRSRQARQSTWKHSGITAKASPSPPPIKQMGQCAWFCSSRARICCAKRSERSQRSRSVRKAVRRLCSSSSTASSAMKPETRPCSASSTSSSSTRVMREICASR
mmetsp:Transcript_63716/g.143358  ORF Transcript_63716/g.143358 Transcript_63716/m.143358 type:complete len:327 (-) Transcript_63716:407-1387(-)